MVGIIPFDGLGLAICLVIIQEFLPRKKVIPKSELEEEGTRRCLSHETPMSILRVAKFSTAG